MQLGKWFSITMCSLRKIIFLIFRHKNRQILEKIRKKYECRNSEINPSRVFQDICKKLIFKKKIQKCPNGTSGCTRCLQSIQRYLKGLTERPMSKTRNARRIFSRFSRKNEVGKKLSQIRAELGVTYWKLTGKHDATVGWTISGRQIWFPIVMGHFWFRIFNKKSRNDIWKSFFLHFRLGNRLLMEKQRKKQTVQLRDQAEQFVSRYLKTKLIVQCQKPEMPG